MTFNKSNSFGISNTLPLRILVLVVLTNGYDIEALATDVLGATIFTFLTKSMF